jgi:hypothetical protein
MLLEKAVDELQIGAFIQLLNTRVNTHYANNRYSLKHHGRAALATTLQNRRTDVDTARGAVEISHAVPTIAWRALAAIAPGDIDASGTHISVNNKIILSYYAGGGDYSKCEVVDAILTWLLRSTCS